MGRAATQPQAGSRVWVRTSLLQFWTVWPRTGKPQARPVPSLLPLLVPCSSPFGPYRM